MGYRDSDDSGFSRHGMNRDSDYHHDPQHPQLQHQRPYRAGFDHPDPARDEDLHTSHSIPVDSRLGRNEPYGGGRDGQGYPGPRNWEGRDPDIYPRHGGGYRNNNDSGYGYGARSPDISGYDPFEAEQQRFRQQQYSAGTHGGGGYGQDDRARLNRPDAWMREGHGGYDRDQGSHRNGRSYGYGYDGRPDARQDAYGSHYQRPQGNPLHYRGGGGSQREHHDPDYAAWRQEQLRLLDEDYDSWRNERYQKFSEEFNTWRSARNRNEGLRGANPPGQVVQGNGKNPQAGATGTTGSNATAPSNTGTTASGKLPKDTN